MSTETDSIVNAINNLISNGDTLRDEKAEAERLLEDLHELKNSVERKKFDFNEQLFQQRSRIDSLQSVSHANFAKACHVHFSESFGNSFENNIVGNFDEYQSNVDKCIAETLEKIKQLSSEISNNDTLIEQNKTKLKEAMDKESQADK